MMVLLEVEVDEVLARGSCYGVEADCGLVGHDLALEGRNQLGRPRNRRRDGRRSGWPSGSFVDCESSGGSRVGLVGESDLQLDAV